MTPRDLLYWMQGAYEWGGGNFSGPLTEQQAKVLTNHVELSKATLGNFHPDLLAFRTWVETAIELGATHEQIAKKLNQMFLHVIDSMTTDPLESAQQSAAHQGQHSGPHSTSALIAKC